jgi:cytoskeletal protein CcmA (bactofilin family)
MMKRKGLWLGLLVVLLLWPMAIASAEGPQVYLDGGQIFVDEDVALQPGETFEGDLGVVRGGLTVPGNSVVNGNVFVTNGDADIAGLVSGNVSVLDGDLSLAETSQVQGDVFVMRGTPDISGQVKGNLSVLFGDAQLRSTAIVRGNVTVLSGALGRDAGAQIIGQEIPGLSLPRLPSNLPSPEIRVTPPAPPQQLPLRLHQDTVPQRLGRFLVRSVMAGLFSLFLVALGALVAFIWPRRTRQVADCIAAIPVQSLGLGLLTFLIAGVLEALAMVLMILIILVAAALISTVILIPIGLLLILISFLVLLPAPVVLAGGMILGWIGLSELVGQKVLKALKAAPAQPLVSTVVGLLITVLLAAVLWIISPVCCGFLFVVLVSSIGLGAVIHTRFGTQGCHQSQVPAVAQPLPAQEMDKEAGKADTPMAGTP